MAMQQSHAPQSQREGRVSGKRYNRIVALAVERYGEWVEYFTSLMLEDGFPPFHVPLSPREQYERLVAWRAAGDPRFWTDAEAQAALGELSMQFGAPPPLTPTPNQVPRQF